MGLGPAILRVRSRIWNECAVAHNTGDYSHTYSFSRTAITNGHRLDGLSFRNASSYTSSVVWPYSCREVNKHLLTPGRESRTDQSKDTAEVQLGVVAIQWVLLGLSKNGGEGLFRRAKIPQTATSPKVHFSICAQLINTGNLECMHNLQAAQQVGDGLFQEPRVIRAPPGRLAGLSPSRWPGWSLSFR